MNTRRIRRAPIRGVLLLAFGELMDQDIIIPEIMELNTINYSIKVIAAPGKPLPNLAEIKNYLDGWFEPHINFDVKEVLNV
jgi:hypothetical protein